ncbi:hypothetical protein JL722_105 [Aureococcus anophagefferens]|nr:hypothetical protein JL722_105 [Aureococcus anophagefferens]
MFTAGEEAASLLADDSRPIADYGAQSPAAAPSHARTRRYAAGALCALAVVALAGARDAPAPARAQTAFAARPALAWEAANEYTAARGHRARDRGLEPGGAGPQGVDLLRPAPRASSSTPSGLRARVTSVSVDGVVAASGGGTVAVRYVRRELRDLSEADRTTWLDARSVDASISTPYWDWTIESKLVEDRVISSPLDTPLWTADWFGSLNYAEAPVVVGPHYGLSTDEFFRRGFEAWAIRDGRWAYATVKRYDDYDADDVDAGLSPAKSWPTCTNLYDFLLPNATAVDFMTHLEDMTVHANVHQVLGGTILDVESTQAMLDAYDAVGSSAASCYQTVAERHLWRNYFSEMKPACDPMAVSTSEDLRACQLDCDALPTSRLAEIGLWSMSNYKCPSDHSVPALDAEGFAAARRAIKRLMPAFSYEDDWATVDGSSDACIPAIGDCFSDGQGTVEDPEDCCAGHFRYSTFYVDVDRTVASAAKTNEAVPGDTLESIEAAAGKAPGAKASAEAPGVAGASMTGEIPIEGGLSRNDASVYVAALSGGLEAVQEAKKDLRTQSGAAKAGFHTGGKPWGGMLLTDRGQYGGLHSDHLDPTFTYDHLAALRPAVDGYDEMRDACAAGGDCAYHFKKTCTYEDAAMRGKDLAYSGVFSCSEACVVDRFYAIDDPDLDLGPDERRSCAQPVLATLFNTPDLFKSCLTPDYDYTRGGAASGADGCHECIDACVDAYPGALTLSSDSDAGCPASPGAYAALALEARRMMTPPKHVILGCKLSGIRRDRGATLKAS